MEKVNFFIDRIENAINCAETGKTKLQERHFNISGMSAKKNRIFLNELLYDNANYLEIGVWHGSTFVAAMYNNNVNGIAIDNFCLFNGNEQYFIDNCKQSGIDKFSFINNDCFNLNEEQLRSIKDIDIYFYDGEHHEIDQLQALTYYFDKMADVFVFIIDDWNHEPAKTGTKLAIKETNVKVHKEWELPASYNGDTSQWWNGLYVSVLSKN
jgi:hypothetical protein